jgi:predicted transcriptional regulator
MQHRNRAKSLRHDIGNLLTIAQANLEGMLDGVVEPTLSRLEAIRDALEQASEHLKSLAALTEEEE